MSKKETGFTLIESTPDLEFHRKDGRIIRMPILEHEPVCSSAEAYFAYQPVEKFIRHLGAHIRLIGELEGEEVEEDIEGDLLEKVWGKRTALVLSQGPLKGWICNLQRQDGTWPLARPFNKGNLSCAANTQALALRGLTERDYALEKAFLSQYTPETPFTGYMSDFRR